MAAHWQCSKCKFIATEEGSWPSGQSCPMCGNATTPTQVKVPHTTANEDAYNRRMEIFAGIIVLAGACVVLAILFGSCTDSHSHYYDPNDDTNPSLPSIMQ